MINISVLSIFFVTLLIGYISGNIHGAYIIGKLFKKVDIREHGSKNSGTTNALRVFGLKLAIPVFLIDFSKAFFPVFFISEILSFFKFDMMGYNDYAITVLEVVVAIGVILGHNYPVVLKFKGGKGIASTVGILFAINYICGLIFCLMMIAIIAITRYVSLASIISTICTPIMLYFLAGRNFNYLILGLIIMVMAVYRHKDNIIRLKSGTERKLGEKIEEVK